jgi:NADH-quinone oxidoreductase subunit M
MLLDSVILIPLLSALIALGAGRFSARAPRVVTLLAVIAQGVVVASLAGRVAGGASVIGARFGDGVELWATVLDGLALPFIGLTVVIGLLAVAASWEVERSAGSHHALLLVLQAAVVAVFLADSLLLFYIAWESVLIPMFVLIGRWGSSNSRRAAMKFALYTFGGGALLLVGVILAIVVTRSVSISDITRAGGVSAYGDAIFWLMALGFLVKLPIVPLHTWLPDAHTEAPTAGSIVLAGVLLKMGGYALIRVAMPFAPEAFQSARGALLVLGIVGIIWGAATALVQTDLKRLVAYSSVAHMGFVAVAVATGTAASLSAAVLTMVSHGLVAGLLFFLVGAVYERTHSRELSRYGGLGSLAPGWSVAFVFASLASAGLPGLSGFPGEYGTILEAFAAYGWMVAPAAVGIVLAASYNLRAVARTVQGPVGEFSGVSDLSFREGISVLLLALLIVAVGVAPHLIGDVVATPIESLLVFSGGGL